MPTDFQIGDWVVYLPEPQKEFEIIASADTPHQTVGGPTLGAVYVAAGFDFLLRRGGHFEGFEPYKSVRKRDIQAVPSRN